MNEIKNQAFMVIDFETVTPKGVPPEPIQVGLVQINDLTVSSVKRKSWYVKPPVFIPLTSFDTKQTGITKKDLQKAKSSDEIFNIIETVCKKNNYIFVAQNANYELSICRRFYKNRPALSSMKFLDTIKLAKLAFPNEKSYKLDNIAKLLNVIIPSGRHTALVDCMITGEVFTRLIKQLNLTNLSDLINISCINKIEQTQMKLFE